MLRIYLSYSIYICAIILTIQTYNILAVTAPKKTTPKHIHDKVSCGSGWQEQYRRLHEPVAQLLSVTPAKEWDKILKQKKLKVAIHLVREGRYRGAKSGGVGDRFAGMITLFALSLLNDVPFFVDFPNLDYAFTSGSGALNWKLPSEEYINYTGFRNVNTIFPFWTQGRYISSFKKSNPTKYIELSDELNYQFENGKFRDKFLKSNVYRAEYLMNIQSVTVVRAAAGYITSLFKKGKYSDRFRQWGLTRENTFGCLFDYLLQPNAALRNEFREEVTALTNPNTLKILIQIRSGDAQIGSIMNTTTFVSQSSTLHELVDRFFSCASYLETQHITTEYSNVRWYLMTDSYVIKQYAIEKYGVKILTHDSRITNMISGGYSARSFMEVIGEQWCGSMCDYFVTSSTRSGLGTQSAFRSRHVTGRVYPIHFRYVSKKDKDGRVSPVLTLPALESSQKCKAISVAELGESYSGI